MRTLDGADALKAAVGEVLGSSDWLDIEQDRIDAFADATNDRQWIHVDPERAADGPFGATIAHGFLTLGLVPSFIRQIYEVTGVQMAINYGLEKVRFPSPVPVGSRIRGTSRLDGITEVAGGVQAVVTTTVEIEGSDKPACVAQTVTRFSFG